MVYFSRVDNISIASWFVSPQNKRSALKPRHTLGRSGLPNIVQRLSDDRLTQRTPAGFPLGMPGMGELMDMAMQQAPHPARHSIHWGDSPLSIEVELRLLLGSARDSFINSIVKQKAIIDPSEKAMHRRQPYSHRICETFLWPWDPCDRHIGRSSPNMA